MHHQTFYRDHLLSCQPMRLECGRYQARVAVTSLGGTTTRSQRFLDLETFNTEAAAVEFARESGMHWIDVHSEPG
jgi:hypothetical protein